MRQFVLKTIFVMSFLPLISKAEASSESAGAYQQIRSVKGRVVGGDDNLPIPGVNIMIKGSTRGTTTDASGNFSLEVDPNTVLVFSAIGYTTQEIGIGDKTTIDVSLVADITTLSEIIVVGYGTQEKKDVTGSIGSVKAEELKSLPVPSIGDALAGRAAGVHVVSSGQPGSDPTFLIRGASSITNNKPLLVIDGMPVESGLNTLNPTDIETIQVLKDASAAAIYGARAANGVIIVTTKRGKGQKKQLNFDYYKAIQQPVNVPKMLSAQQFAEYSNEMLEADGRATNPEWQNPSSLGTGTKWSDELFRTAPMDNLSLSYASGNDNSNFYISTNFLNQDGIINTTSYKRYTLQVNSDHTLFDRLQIGNNLTLNHDVKRSGNFNIRNTLGALPMRSVRNADGTYTHQSIPAEWYGTIDNPIGKLETTKNETKGYNLIGSLYADLRIIDGLNLRTNLGLQANFWDTFNFTPKYDWPNVPQSETYLGRGFNKNYQWVWDNTLTYTRVFAEKHALTLMAGTSAQERYFEFVSGSRTGFLSNATQVIGAGQDTNIQNDGGINEWSLFGYFGRVNYSFASKYLLTATVRRDGSSKFGPNNRYGTFPSLSAAWRISEEAFFSDNNIVSDFKLRVGYGTTGNQEIGDYAYTPYIVVGTTSMGGTLLPTAYPVTLANQSIRWETVEQFNLGFDAELLKGRLGVNLDAFVKNTEDMLVRGVVVISTGYDNENEGNRPFVNAGKMQNKGIEVTLNSKNLVGPLSWNSSLNFTYLRNKIVSLNDSTPQSRNRIDGNINSAVSRFENGHPFNAFFGYVTDGIFQSEEEVAAHAYQDASTSPGDIKFKDLNYDGVIDDKDRRYIGNPNPRIMIALNNAFAYKNFDLNIFLQGVYGVDLFNANRIEMEGMDAARNMSVATLNRWTPENRSNEMPRAIFGNPSRNNRISDRYIEDGSYLRIKNVTLGYRVPATLLEKARISSLRVYASVQNLYTFTNYSGIDPEIGLNGVDSNTYPLTRTYSIGVNLGF